MQVRISEKLNLWLDDMSNKLELKKGAPEDVVKEFEAIMVEIELKSVVK